VRLLIVDDEDLGRSLLTQQLRETPDVEVVGTAANGLEAIRLTEVLLPDLLLLDVQMPKLSGLEVLELLGARAPAVIFVTAHDQFAVRAFEVHAVDYLLKPVEPVRLAQALARARHRLGSGVAPAGPAAADLARAARPAGQPLERVVIREGAQVHVVPVSTIDYIEAQNDYLCVVAGGRRLRKQQTLAQLESQLDHRRFVRVHRSFLLNIERVTRIDPYGRDSWQVILTGGGHLPMSRSGYERLKEILT
jgi:two-component system LytT family response regulator